ncbi:tetratricopeptide repeat protein [Caenimonas terrae]|uniref:Tetratricopeptide repeat protein 38 n=1 Tax=Caenimonas terrae TaxID=696074 RepID=A0ABW0N5Q7_9BURK
MWTDGLGNPLGLQHAASLAGTNDFVEGFMASQSRVGNILETAAADEAPLVQAYAAALHMFAETRSAGGNARPFLDKALASPLQPTARESSFIEAVRAWVDGDVLRSVRVLEQHLRNWPRDLVALKLAHYHLFNLGDSPGMLRLALACLPHAADVPYLHGMLAFAWEQCHLLEQAEASARRAIAMERNEPWAHHALAHVMLTQGRIREGHDFLASVSDSWVGLNSFMVTHNWWHQALFALELERHEEALALYDSQVWGVAKDYSQDEVNAVSLLARLELAGADVGQRWQDLADHLLLHLDDQVLPFLDMQYLYGLARAGRPQADRLLHNIETHAAQVAPPLRHAWQRVCVPASRGLLAHARGDWARAVDQLGQALPRLTEIGGSHAQRDLFAQVHLDALVRDGHLAAAQHLLQQQLRGQPESLRLRHQAARVYRGLGLGEIAASLA